MHQPPVPIKREQGLPFAWCTRNYDPLHPQTL